MTIFRKARDLSHALLWAATACEGWDYPRNNTTRYNFSDGSALWWDGVCIFMP